MKLIDENWILTTEGQRLVKALETVVPANLDGISYLQAVHGLGGNAFQEPRHHPARFFGRDPGRALRLWEAMQPMLEEKPAPMPDTLAEHARQLETKLAELQQVIQEGRNRDFPGLRL